ncbi:endolytic transglycosylase MltG [Hymenobacter humi]|uniref:Endolytic transglycosylase MltG n=1 Tax=Hymenobacter humi TaxID=1411620 RepID=A0ABW2U4X6_9BACT
MRRPLLFGFLIVLLVLLGAGGYAAWRVLYRPNVTAFAEGPAYLYIRTGTGFTAVLDSLTKHRLLQEPATFAWVAEQQDYPTKVKAGRYRLDPNLGNLDLVKMLALGYQDTVQFELKPFHYLDRLPRQVSRHLETDSFKLRCCWATTPICGRATGSIPAPFAPCLFRATTGCCGTPGPRPCWIPWPPPTAGSGPPNAGPGLIR